MADFHPVYTLIASVPIALFTSWVTVRLSLRKFQSEKWFERKIDAYTKIIESLHHMKTVTARQLRAERRGADIPEEVERELIESYRSNLAELRRLADMGSLVFSTDAIGTLETFSRELESATPDGGWWEYYDVQSAAVNNCLESIRKIAKRDLNA